MNRTISPQDLKSLLVHQDVTLLDVRRRNDFDADAVTLPAARWKDPEQVAEWSKTLPRDKEVVIYCVRGGSVSNSVLDHLLGQGLQARYIEGGIEGWKQAGGATRAKS
jgi:rhodanese-related sulfurtransferase